MIRVFLSFLFICLVVIANAGTVFVNKAGQLEKEIKRNKIINDTVLIINGEVNFKDIANLGKYPHLKSIEFKDVSLIQNNKKDNLKIITFPNLPNLETLAIDDKFGANRTFILSNLPNIKNLSSSTNVAFYNIQPEYLENLMLWGPTADKNFDKRIYTKRLLVPNKNWITQYNRNGKLNYVLLRETYNNNENVILDHYSNKYPELLQECDIISKFSFSSYPDSKITLPKSIKEVDNKAFIYSKINEVEFPDIQMAYNLKNNIEFPAEITVIIPLNSYSQFKNKITSPIFEKGKKHTYVYSPDKDGSLNEFFKKINLLEIDTLKIFGKIADNYNFDLLTTPNNIRVIDLSNTEIVKVASSFKDEEYLLVKEVVDDLMNNYIDKGKEIQNSYNYSSGLLSLLGALTDELQPQYQAQLQSGDLSVLGKATFNNMLNEKVKQDQKTIKKPDDRMAQLTEEYQEKFDIIAGLSDQFNRAMEEYVYVDDEEWIEVPDVEAELIMLQNLRGKEFTEEEKHSPGFPGLLSSISPKYSYSQIWSSKEPGGFRLEKQRKTYKVLEREGLYDEDGEVKDLIVKLNQLNKKISLPAEFNNIPYLNTVIINKNQSVNSNNISFNLIFK